MFIEEHTPATGPRCDFCSSPDVRWAYPCRDHTQPTERADTISLTLAGELEATGLDITYRSRGSWAACPTCKKLIQRGDRERLAQRSATGFARVLPPALLRSWSYSNRLDFCRRRHDQFWSHREGAPRRVHPGERIE